MNSNYNYTIKEVHVSTIRGGDTVMYGGVMKTVSFKDIKHGVFMVSTLFGDSHKLGRILVKKINFKN